MKSKRNWFRYLMLEWVIPLGLGALLVGGVIGFLWMVMRMAARG